jgi:hypothetical protein
MNKVDEALVHLSTLVTTNTKAMGTLSARNMVLGCFFDVVLTHLTTAQRGNISMSFRRGIEDILSLMDDVPLPAEYHTSLLELTNTILASLNQESATPQ